MLKNSFFFKLLKISNYRNFWILQVFTLIAMQFYFLSLSWITLGITESTMILGTLLTITAIPRLILIPIGGALFDNISPKKLLFINILILVISTIIFTVIILLFKIQIWILILFAIFFGISSALFLPTSFALIPKLVSQDLLQQANSFSQLSMQLANTFGPAIAGVLISIYGIPFVYGTMSFLFSLSLIFTLLLETRKFINKDNSKTNNKLNIKILVHDLKEGVQIVGKDKLLFALIIISVLLNLSIIGPQQIGLPYIANQTPEGGAENLGLLMSSLGGGTLFGVLLIGIFKNLKQKSMVTIGFTITLGLFWSFVGYFPEYLYVIAVLLFFSGLFIGGLNVLVVTLIQQRAPSQALGRVMSLQLLGSTGIQPITFLIVGWLLGIISPGFLFLLGGCTLILTGLISLCFKQIRITDKNNNEEYDNAMG